MITNALLYFTFFCIITPVGICLRLIFVDILHLKRRPYKKTYWTKRPHGSERKFVS